MQELRAEMAATVWKVVASPGDRVAEGDVIVVLESMKMEMPVESEWSGVVAQVLPSAGEVLAEGDLIAVIDDLA